MLQTILSAPVLVRRLDLPLTIRGFQIAFAFSSSFLTLFLS